MSRLPPRPDLDWKDDGTPVSRAFDDIYFSLSDGLEETRSVFLKACGLPERWANRQAFTVAELGFGTGLNFLGLVECWLASKKPQNAWLHFTSVEKYLMSAEDAGRALGRWPDVRPYAEALLKRWPERARGLQRIEFPEYRVTLTLYVGDAESWLTECSFLADAWFLDGFAPAKNDSMWADALYGLIAGHSAPGCQIGTYTVAGAVRRGLAEAGFEVSKQPGFGRKRERLEAVWPVVEHQISPTDIYLTCPERVPFDRVVVVGAGIAGACVAAAFAGRGFPVTVLDAGSEPASGASGNPYGLVMPRLDAADTPQARFLLQAYLRAVRYYAEYTSHCVDTLSVQQIAPNEKERLRFQKLLADPPLDESRLVGDDNGLLHYGALLVRPADIVQTLLSGVGTQCLWNQTVTSLEDARSRFGDRALIVITAGWLSAQLLERDVVSIAGRLGQVDWGLTRKDGEPSARAAGTYILKAERNLLFGATFEPFDQEALPEVSDSARAENVAAAGDLAPDWMSDLDLTTLKSRASVRGTTPDRMPVAGVLPDRAGALETLSPLSKGMDVSGSVPHSPLVYVLTGLGARGFTFAPLLADLIAAQALGEPLPIARPECEQVSPVRFLIRAARRGTSL